MILYIHGFGSSGNSNKGRILKKYFGEEFVLTPTLPTKPTKAIKYLKEIISTCKAPLMLVGSSLGGYYGIYLSSLFSLPCILINPAINAHITLEKYIGKQKFYESNKTFIWSKEDIEKLKSYKITQINKKHFLLMQEIEDELLDYKEAVTLFSNAQILLVQGGSHEFNNFERYLYLIKHFYMKQFSITSL